MIPRMDTVFNRIGLPVAYRQMSQQLLSYFLVAGTAAVVDIATVFTFLQLSTAHYLYAIGLGFVAGTTTNFLLSLLLVFDRTDGIIPVYLKHLTSSLVGLTVNVSVVVSLVELFTTPVIVAKISALACSFFVNFFLIKFFAFRDRRL